MSDTFHRQHRMSRRSLVKGLGLAGLAAGGMGIAAGCGASSTPAASGRGAGLQGRVSFSNYEGWIGKQTIAAFENKHAGVEINEVHVDGSFTNLIPKLKQQPGLYDMALASIDGVGRGLEVGVIAQMDFDAMPNIKHVDPKFLNVGVNSGGNYFVPTDNGKVGIALRKDLVPETVRSWSDLWAIAPKYKDSLFVYDYDKDLMGTAMLLNGFKVNSRVPAEIEAAGESLKQLKPSIATLGTSGIGAALVNGDASIAIAYDYDIFAAQQANPNVEWIAPEEGMTGYLEGWVALEGTKGLDVIQAFTDFHLRPKYYADFVKRTSASYVETGIDDRLPDAISSSPILFPPEDVLSRVTFEEFLGDAEPLYNKAYTEFKAH